MPKVCTLVLGMADAVPSTIGDIVGADRGALILAEQSIPIDLSIGDFDSVTEEQYEMIRTFSKEVVRLNPIKDDSDSEAAITELLKRGYEKIIVVGAFGGRMDHTIVNLRLAERHPGIVILADLQNRIQAVEAGTYTIEKKDFTYVSFFALGEAVISLKGMKYPLDHKKIVQNDLYGLSNEILEESGTLRVHEGKVLVIQSKDEKRSLNSTNSGDHLEPEI